jgi:hypothetical protein
MEEKPDIIQALDAVKDDLRHIMDKEPDWRYFADDFAIVDRTGSKICEGEGLPAVKLLLQQIRHARSQFMSRHRIRFEVNGDTTVDGWCDAQWNVRLDGVNYPSWHADNNAVVNLHAKTRFHIDSTGKIDRMQIDSLIANRQEYKLLLNQMLERELADDAEDDEDGDTSFMSVAKWPSLRLYTFGEPAFSPPEASLTEEQVNLLGARMIYYDDPVPTVLGQAIGFSHDARVPLVNFTMHITEEHETDLEGHSLDAEPIAEVDEYDDDIEEDFDADENDRTSPARLTRLNRVLSLFKKKGQQDNLRYALDQVAAEIEDDDEYDEGTYEELASRMDMPSRRIIPILDKVGEYRKAALQLSNQSFARFGSGFVF